ncbi:hypothetical protein [Desulfofustis limnaeus]|uniref:DNA primase/helicase Gp4 N-terminal Bacteriophage T7-like domain-containing protein n=1 Tax=Desulfofustis limnaeus TaxID=2740163 RepID=A0ABM7WCT2_9BACT|nr:hypothetical protein [Desulfofustis limnaeus]BDD88726.1 hypothetical protein DPPLL_30910 [Desulfofustis limnaeus]
MNLIDLIPGLRKASTTKGGEYHGACPLCGDGGKGRDSDRFHVWPAQGTHGTFWCRVCSKAGDAIEFLRLRDGLGYREACAQLDIEPQRRPALERPSGFVPAPAAAPVETWSIKAAALVERCHAALLANDEQLLWLALRGIDRALVERYRLGWLDKDQWRERRSWGLAAESKPDGSAKKLWFPAGLVIPIFDGGRVVQVRIRRPAPERGPRYYVVPGSSRQPLITRDAEAYVVVESGLDAILLDGVAGDLVGVVALGNDTSKPPVGLWEKLQRSLHISVSLDSDTPRRNEVTGAMDIPGAKASRWWLEQFEQAERVPVIGGKDPGEVFQAGGDLRTWVLAGLPPRFHVAPLPAAGARPERQGQPSDAGELEYVKQLADGREITVTNSRQRWAELTEAGRIVFSENELARLHAAVSGMDEERRQRAALLAADIKEVFAGAYIQRGVAVEKEAA